ncbi:MAG: YhcH/YjgK/YiaL family protein [Spirochaetaceae bacterium]|jgi:YhcH/YjgK/YiaL family protein|nr:YhcH/YjgK/YiaL family protein [Spirochaetaceae bacterium]
MIYDTLDNAKYYYGVSPRVEKAFRFLQETDLKTLAEGKHHVSGGDVVATVWMNTTKPYREAKLETHDKFLDLQYLVEGKEDIFVGFVQDTAKVIEEQPDKDCRFYEGFSRPLPIGENRFLLLFPGDTHAPGLHYQDKEPQTNKKILVKIKV